MNKKGADGPKASVENQEEDKSNNNLFDIIGKELKLETLG